MCCPVCYSKSSSARLATRMLWILVIDVIHVANLQPTSAIVVWNVPTSTSVSAVLKVATFQILAIILAIMNLSTFCTWPSSAVIECLVSS